MIKDTKTKNIVVNFEKYEINSKSIVWLTGKIKIELKKKFSPNPKNKFLKKKPEKMLNTAKKNRGKY
jgi:hypothetical protein